MARLVYSTYYYISIDIYSSKKKNNLRERKRKTEQDVIEINKNK